MKTKNIIKGLSLLFAVLAFGSCKKESENIFTMFKDVKVTFEDRGPYAITEDAVVNDGDSVNIYYTITSPNQAMFQVAVDSTQGNGVVATRKINLDESQRHEYSGVIRMKMQRDGKTTFRVYGLSEDNIFLGDGYTSITVEEKASYIYLTNRKVYPHVIELPEGSGSIADGKMTGERKSFFSLATGESFNYEEATANSDKIDFGIYFKIDTRETNYGDLVYNLYSPSTSENPLPELDMSGWTKRNTLFSAPIEAAQPTFVNDLSSSSKIQEKAEAVDISLTQSAISESGKAFSPGNMYYFLTPEGKYGAIYISQLSSDAIGGYFSISVKIQK